MEDLQIAIIDQSQANRNQMSCQVVIPLNRLKDQQMHEEQFDLYD